VAAHIERLLGHPRDEALFPIMVSMANGRSRLTHFSHYPQGDLSVEGLLLLPGQDEFRQLRPRPVIRIRIFLPLKK
jgi:hypothetical protein